MSERVLMGQTNAEIAPELFISVATVKSHISDVFDKLGVADRHAAIDLLRGTR